ncbi:hypothetical protein [Amycolatopsis sp. NPDC059657]|uniref:hypothetical protein n=1 Tax=Amycolatopsis sp. NPDC059657 TaxID=3346899 RepID=UPI00366CAEB6
MIRRYPGAGTVVEFRGTVYPKASVLHTGEALLTYRGEDPPDPRFHYLEKWKAWQANIPLAECDSAYSVSSKGTYHGLNVQVISVSGDGNALLYYLGGETADAEAEGFEQSDPGTFSILVPLREVHRYREEWRDLLFPIWREQEYAKPQGEGVS